MQIQKHRNTIQNQSIGQNGIVNYEGFIQDINDREKVRWWTVVDTTTDYNPNNYQYKLIRYTTENYEMDDDNILKLNHYYYRMDIPLPVNAFWSVNIYKSEAIWMLSSNKDKQISHKLGKEDAESLAPHRNCPNI